MPLDQYLSAPALGPGDAVVFSDRALYETYNFHDPEAVERLARWLARRDGEDASGVSVVAGRPGSGRDYLVRAAAWRAGERGAPVRHARLSFDGFDPDHHASMTAFADHQLRMHFAPAGDDLPAPARDRRGALLDLAASLPASFLGAAGIAFLVKAAVSVVDLQSLLRPGAPALAGPAARAEDHLRAILDFATRAARLVLVLPADELPEPVVQWFVHEPRRNHRLSVVLAMAAAPAADALYGEPLAHVVEAGQMTPESLRERVGLRFGPNEFPDRFFSGLWKRTQGVAGQVALAMMDLDRLELVTRGSGPGRPWRLAVEPDDERLVEYFASHFYDQLNQIRNQHGPMDLHVVRFVELAALCGSIAPPRLIAGYMALTDADRDVLLDRADELRDGGRPVFTSLDYQHPTFTGPSAPEMVYRFSDESNRLIVLRRMVHRGREAKGLLEYLSGIVPLTTRGAAELFASLATHLPADSDTKAEYTRLLQWWVAEEEADQLAEQLGEQVRSGEVSSEFLWSLVQRCPDWPFARRLALTDAMRKGPDGIDLGLLPAFHALRADLFYSLGRNQESLRECEAGLQAEEPPELMFWFHHRALLVTQCLDTTAALYHADRAYALCSGSDQLHGALGCRVASDFATALIWAGRPDEARLYAAQALALSPTLREERHPEAWVALTSLGLAMRHLEDDEQAAECHRLALEIHETVADLTSPTARADLACCLYNFGSALRRVARYDDACQNLVAAADMILLTSGPGHPLYGRSLIELVLTEAARGAGEEMLAWVHRLDPVVRTASAGALVEFRYVLRGAALENLALPPAVRDLLYALREDAGSPAVREDGA